MPAENDVPLGEGARRYYEQQFGERIRQVNKGGGPVRNPGGSNWSGRAGAGAVLAIVVLVIRIFLAASRSGSHTPSYTHDPPPNFDELQKRLNDIKLRVDKDGVFVVPNGMPIGANGPLLVEEDVPSLEGLCYRIRQESLWPAPTPGGRILQLLREENKKVLIRAAQGKAVTEDEQDELLDALGAVLMQPDFTDGPNFNLVPGFVALRLMRDRPVGGAELGKYNRQVLAMCYPEQIVPLNERPNLTPQMREQWRKRAEADLEKAKREAAKP